MNKQATINKEENRPGEMAQQLRGQTALREDQVGLAASMWDDSQLPTTLAPGNLPQVPVLTCIHPGRDTCIYIKFKKEINHKNKAAKERGEGGGEGRGREGTGRQGRVR